MSQHFIWKHILHARSAPSPALFRRLRRELRFAIGFLACCVAVQPWLEGPAAAQSVADTSPIPNLPRPSPADRCESDAGPAPPGPMWLLWRLLDDPDLFEGREFDAVLNEMLTQYGGSSAGLEWSGLTGVPCTDVQHALETLPAATIAANIGSTPWELCLFDAANPPAAVSMELLTKRVEVPSPAPDLCVSLAYASFTGPSGTSGALVVLLDAADPFGAPVSAAMPVEDLTLLRAADPAYLPDFDASLPSDLQEWWAVLSASSEPSEGGLCLSKCWTCADLCPEGTGVACVNYGPACRAKDPLTIGLHDLRRALQDSLDIIAVEFFEAVKDRLWDALLCAAAMLGIAALGKWLSKLGTAVANAVQRGAAWSMDNLDLSNLGKLIGSLLLKNSNAISIIVQIGVVAAVCLSKLAVDIMVSRKVRATKEAAAWNEYHRKVQQLLRQACGCLPGEKPFAGESACVLAAL